MNFTLSELKELYEKYSIIKKGKNEVVISKYDSENVYISDIKLVTSVKFAYAWVYANSSNFTKNFLNVTDDMNFAFTEDSEYLYDVIMEISKEFMEVTGDMIKCEALINFVLEDEDISGYVVDIIKYLYSTEEIYKSFEDWIIYLVKSSNSKTI